MIFLDANVFLRAIAPAPDEPTRQRQLMARALFKRVEAAELDVTTSEVALHETCFILSSPRQYAAAPSAFVPDLAYLLTLAGMRFPRGDQAIFLRALDLYLERPTLEFSDAVIAARFERAGHDLATFDRHFDAIPTVARWQWEPPIT